MELLPERLPPIEWNGARVSCIPDGPDKPQWSLSEIHVTSHMRHSIVEAVAMAQHGRSLASDEADADADDADGTDTRAAAEYRPDAGLRRLGLRVLVAEDNPVNRTLLVRQLEELGCEVTLCVDGVETLARWNADEFDVLITDMNMPLMNGYELVRALRARSTNAPIIGLTAN
ncbi:response regulator, partial [Ralstonia pseudosolanacearum]|uniref:response regulator n=1 Tax=Ralstonia pseudosolanacearum TaxID=1310165 RepID=UPI003CE916F8